MNSVLALNRIALSCFWKAFTRKQFKGRQALNSHTMTGTYRLRNDFCCLFTVGCHKHEKKKRKMERELRRRRGREGCGWNGGLLLCGVTQWLYDSCFFFLSVVLYFFNRKQTKQDYTHFFLSFSPSLSLSCLTHSVITGSVIQI